MNVDYLINNKDKKSLTCFCKKKHLKKTEKQLDKNTT